MYNVLSRYLCILGAPSVTDSANPEFYEGGSRTWISLDISHLFRSIASHPAGPHDRLAPITVIGAPLLWASWVDTICTLFARPL